MQHESDAGRKRLLQKERPATLQNKKAILEVTSIEAAKVVVSKAAKKVFVTEGENLKLIAEMKSKKDIIWEAEVSDAVKTRYALLME